MWRQKSAKSANCFCAQVCELPTQATERQKTEIKNIEAQPLGWLIRDKMINLFAKQEI